mgnify:CR=1 FL=1
MFFVNRSDLRRNFQLLRGFQTLRLLIFQLFIFNNSLNRENIM